MALSGRRPVWLLPVLFLGLLFGVAWQRDPDFWRTSGSLYRLAQEATARQDFQGALEPARKLRSRNPDHSGYGVYLGWLYLQAGQADAALKVWRQVWNRDQQALGALIGQAQALEQLGKRPAALELLATHLEKQPQQPEVLQCAGEIAARRPEDLPLAVTYYQRLYQQERDPQLRGRLVDLLVALGRHGEAIPLQEEQAAQSPEDQEALHRLALLHYWQRDYQAATQVYQRLLERAGEDAVWRREAAQAADAAQALDTALQHYLWLYGREGGKKEDALALARLWSRKGRHPEAVAVLAPLMREQPEPELRRWYALELLLTRDFAKSRQAYRAAWEAGDTHQETIINLARLYAQGQQFGKAAHFWDEAQRRQLVRGELRQEAALTYSYAHRFQDAVEVLQPVDRDDPKNPRLRLFLGQMHFYQKHWGQAAHYFRDYLAQQPHDLEVRRQLAEALSFQAETRGEALEQYGEALKRQDDPVLRLRRLHLLLQEQRWQEVERELQACPPAQDPQVLREQARLCLWAGDLEGALARYDRYLPQAPQDREAGLEKARVLIYLRRAPEAREVLRGLRVSQVGVRLDQTGDRRLLTASVEAALAQRDWPEAERWAMRLYCSQFPQKHRQARNWQEAWQWQADAHSGEQPDDSTPSPKTIPAAFIISTENRKQKTENSFPRGGTGETPVLPTENRKPKTENSLSVEERTWVARALCRSAEPQARRLAADLAAQNLHEKRYHHPSLLILSHLLPLLPRYEDLNRMAYRIPGIRREGPEYVAALAFFTGNLGRQGGKLDYLLHVLKEYRRHKPPQSPGELLGLADLALELGQPREAEAYYRRALAMKPHDRQIAALLLNCQMAQKEWGKALAGLQGQGQTPQNALDAARLYLLRGQYEGVKAAVTQVPEGHADRTQALLLLAQAQRGERQHRQALETLGQLEGRLPREQWLMEKARVLEDMGDRGAVGLYEEIIRLQPDTQAARVAAARRARAREQWAGAYKAYALALKEAPQDIELLNELEYIRQKMRPQVASRGFPYSRGQRRPEEAKRPWQFSRFDRDPRGLGLTNYLPGFLWDVLPIVQPESLGLTDSNKLYGGIFRASGAFWITKALPAQIGMEFREYNQTKRTELGVKTSPFVTELYDDTNSRLRRAEVSLGLGPLAVADRLRLTGEIIGRRYWKREDHDIKTLNVINPFFPQTVALGYIHKEHRNRLLGSLDLGFSLGSRTEANLKYSRRDIFDQEAYLYPRLYQAVLNLAKARITTLHQVEMGYTHQFRPGLDWRGNVGGAFFSDGNRRFTSYQGLTWQALKQPRMQLELIPHFYYAAYRQRQEAYFSPDRYVALGLGADFHRQIFRLPTLILQGTVQAVGQHGDWGPSLQGLAALEWELVHNFFADLHVFYFREWVDNYRLLTGGVSFRWHF